MCRRVMEIGCVLAATLALSAPPASADNTTCANADFLFMGVARSQSFTGGMLRFYKVRVVAGRSYVVYSWAPFQDAGEGGARTFNTFYSDSTCSTLANTRFSVAREPTVDVSGHTGDNNTIIPDFTGTMYIRVSNEYDQTYTIHTVIQETTIFSPWWYVGGTNNAFAELKNATDAGIDYTLTAYTSSGSACGTSSGTISANGNTAINIRTLGTCLAAGSGSAQVAFQGPPGAITGNITTLDATTGLSFDAPFTARMPWAISTQ